MNKFGTHLINYSLWLAHLYFPPLRYLIPSSLTDCQEAFEAGDVRSGEVYNLKPETSPKVFHAVCEFDSASGWTVILKRLDGSIDFYRNFADYTDGFGDLDGEYWIGKTSPT